MNVDAKGKCHLCKLTVLKTFTEKKHRSFTLFLYFFLLSHDTR